MNEIKRGELYYANLCPVVGSEQGGIRPVVIIQNDTGNKHSPTTIVAAITSKEKSCLPTHVTISGCGLPALSIVLLEHIRTIDKTRLGERIGTLPDKHMKRIDKAIVVSFGINYLEDLPHGLVWDCYKQGFLCL